MKTPPVQSHSIDAIREIWNQIITKLAKQVMQDWVAEQKEPVSQMVQSTNSPKTDR